MLKHGWKKSVRRGGITALLAISTVGFLAPPAEAAVSDFTDFASGRQLSDAELGQMRGRFVDKGSLMFFGVQMTSEWRTSQGEHLMVQGNLLGDLRGRVPKVTFEPRLTMISTKDQGVTGPGGNGSVVRDAGTGNARGVVQTIQAGGNFNAAANDLQIDVLDASARSGVQQGGPAGAIDQRLPSGTRVMVRQDERGMGVEMQMPGMGRVSQAIVPGRGLRQSIQLTSDLQQVRNLTRLQLYMDRRSANAGAPGVRSAVESARQLRR